MESISEFLLSYPNDTLFLLTVEPGLLWPLAHVFSTSYVHAGLHDWGPRVIWTCWQVWKANHITNIHSDVLSHNYSYILQRQLRDVHLYAPIRGCFRKWHILVKFCNMYVIYIYIVFKNIENIFMLHINICINSFILHS